VQSRIVALSRSHDLLVNGEWIGVDLGELVRTQLEPFCSADRCEITGPSAMLKPLAVQYLGMAVHELATNSAKYGALSVPEGRLAVKWSFGPRNGTEPALTLTWTESGGPPPRRTGRSGFGRQVLENLAPSALEGTGKLTLARTGLVWTLEVSRSVLVDSGEPSELPAGGTDV
jgi:two-component sensor histidine kinase